MAQARSSAGKGDKDKCRHSANLYNRKTSRYYERSLVSLYDLKYICAKQVKIPTQQSNLSNKQQAEEEITPHNSFRQLIASWTIDVSDKSHERRITEHLPPEPNQDLNPTTSTSQTLHSKLTRGFFCVHLKTPLLLRGQQRGCLRDPVCFTKLWEEKKGCQKTCPFPTGLLPQLPASKVPPRPLSML